MVLPLGDAAPTRIIPYVTYALIGLNVAAYLVQLELGEQFTVAYAATPYEITHNKDIHHSVEIKADEGEDVRTLTHASTPFPVWLTLLTAMFLHANPLHLSGNMLYLWIFGDNVEEVIGSISYLFIYLFCGVVGTLCQVFAAPDSTIPTLGASGAIAGVMGMYVVWFPRNRVRVLVLRVITEWPALVVIGGWITLQIVYGIGSARLAGKVGGVAYLAHVGGAATGLLAAVLLRDRASAYSADLQKQRVFKP